MRIAYDYQIFSAQEWGGISRYFVEMATELSQAPDTSVRVLCPLYVNSYLAHADSRLAVTGRHVPRSQYTGAVLRSVNRLVTPSLLKRYNPEVLHETYYSTASLASKHTKIIVTVHDMIHELFPECFPPNDPVANRKRAAVERADHIICVSEQTRNDLVSVLGVDSAKTSVVHNGVFNQLVAAKSTTGRNRFVLYVGNRGGYKNFQTLLRAFASSSALQDGYQLVAFGGGPLSAQELALARELGVEPRFLRQLGGNDEVLAHLYQTASLFVYPSLYEGFGLPPLEAMTFGCPVICSRASAIPEIVGDAAEYFSPNSIEELTATLDRVLGDSSLRASLVERGGRRITRFTWRQCARQTLGVYRAALH